MCAQDRLFFKEKHMGTMNFVVERSSGERVRVPVEADSIEIMRTSSGPVLAVWNGSVARLWPLMSNEPPWWLKSEASKVEDARRHRFSFRNRMIGGKPR
jgi:hypothetical protein